MPKSLWAALGLLLAAGCNSSIAMPNLLHPGSLAYQRWRAEFFDPYPQPDLGTPVIGGRPPQFTTTVPQSQLNGPGLFDRFGPQPAKYSMQEVP